MKASNYNKEMTQVDKINKSILLSILQRKITEQASSLDEVQEIIQELQQTDWTSFNDTLMRSYCHNSICGAFVLPEELRENPQIIRKHRRYCIHCEDVVMSSYTYPCDNCGLLYDRLNNGRTETCGECVNYKITQQVEANLARATNKKLPATLTIHQWMQNIRYFENACAYCGEEKDIILEHFIPLTRNGGTTQDNCIPACNSCNIRKGNRSPDSLSRYFFSENIQNIQKYLASIREQPRRISVFKEGDWVTCSIPSHKFYGAIGTVARVHEQMNAYDIQYSDGSPHYTELFPTRWHRPYAFLKEEELQASEPTERYKEMERIHQRLNISLRV